MKKLLFAANWKMNFSAEDAQRFFTVFKNLPQISENKEILFFPPQQLLVFLQQLVKGKFKIGAQNVYFEDSGAFTGEVSIPMLQKDHITHFLLGHSERRSLCEETDALIHQKILASQKYNAEVILCVGENKEKKENGQEFEFVQSQLTSALKNTHLQEKYLTIAYEPIWAIGTGKIPSLDDIQHMHSFIRSCLHQIGFKSDEIRVIYGGSVNVANSSEILSLHDVDGVLVGSASLEAHGFHDIIQSTS